MEIAILVFFIAIFGGVLFLLALVWFIFRRLRRSRSASRNFAGGSNSGGAGDLTDDSFTDDDAAAIYAGSSLFADQEREKQENPVLTETAQDSSPQRENTYSHESYGASAAPAESSYSSSDSGSSYDSGSSSSDSGSSDSGSSGSSSD